MVSDVKEFSEDKVLVSREQFLENMALELDDPIGDIKWVYQALGAEGLKPEDAPSPGAWGLYQELKDEVAWTIATGAGQGA